jgi:predicted negative regulator of RcsB-dependent stress response
LDEYLSDRERLDAVRAWWHENGWYLIGGLALGALLLFGWNRYQASVMRDAEAAGELYAELRAAVEANTTNRARELYAELAADYPTSPYADQAALLVARMDLVTSPEVAETELRKVVEQSADPGLQKVARLRLARQLMHRESYSEALALLDIDDPGPFAARFNEVTGDIHVALGDHESARAAYQRALATPTGELLLDRTVVQMKLDDLPAAGAPARTETGE